MNDDDGGDDDDVGRFKRRFSSQKGFNKQPPEKGLDHFINSASGSCQKEEKRRKTLYTT